MKKVFISVLFVVFALSFASFSAQLADTTLNVGAGMFAGMTCVKTEVTFTGSSAGLNVNDLYIRTGLAYVDSQNVTPTKDWRKAVPVYVEGIYYIADKTYAGAGINFPLMVSDKLSGEPGGQVFVGYDFKVDTLGKMFVEAGYSTVNIHNDTCFSGLHLIVGSHINI